MQKVYLLLRNNQQTGPYTFEELLQLHLKPFDLIWVEGKSYGWRYPTEVESLKPYFTVPENPRQEEAKPLPVVSPSSVVNAPVQPKNIFVSMPVNGNARPQQETKPVDPIEQKAEELRKRVQSFTPQQEPIKTNYARDLEDAEEEYTKWIYQKKTKKNSFVNKKSLTLAGLCLVLVLASWWMGAKFFNPRSIVAEKTTVVKDPVKTELPSANDIEAWEENTSLSPVVSSSIDAPSTSADAAAGEHREKILAQKNTKQIPSKEQKTILPAPIHNEPIQETNDYAVSEQEEKEVIAEAPVETKENKKTLKEKIGELFGKRKGENPAEVESGSAEKNNSERKSSRRGESEATPILIDVSNEVEIKTNKIADSWMIGVKGLKLTLYNRSGVTINSAKVEVLYYSEQNNLLEKKMLSYSNIPPKKSQTVAAPDQRLADHIEYKVLSATGIENAYATK